MNKRIALLLLGVIACAMGIILFLQMEQRLSKETLSDKSSLLSSVKDSTEVSAPTPATPPTKDATTLPATLSSLNATVKKIPLEQEKSPAQQKVEIQETASTQERTPIQKKIPVPAQEKTKLEITQKIVNASASSDRGEATPQTKEPFTKKPRENNKPAPAAKTDTSLKATETHEMTSLAVQLSGATVHVIIKANNAFAYKTMLLSSPDRLVIDLPGTWKKVATTTIPKNRLLEKIRTGSQPAGPRIVLDLKTKPKKYDIYKIDTSTLEIVIE